MLYLKILDNPNQGKRRGDPIVIEETLARFVRIDTDSVSKRNYREMTDIIREEADKLDVEIEEYDAEPLVGDGLTRPNLVITKRGLPEGKTILLVTHYDIVPPGDGWSFSPFEPFVKDGKLYGRGASDAKSGIAAGLAAFKEIQKPRNTLKLLVTCDEEVGGIGIDYLINEVEIPGDFAVIVDAGPELLSIGASGVFWGKITVKGKQAHAGYPFRGVNAIQLARKVLDKLAEYEKMISTRRSKLNAPPESPYKKIWPRFSVTMINSGEKENIIPRTCEIRFDRRMMPEEVPEEVETEFKKFLESNLSDIDYDFETIHLQSGYFTDPTNPIIDKFKEIIYKLTGVEKIIGTNLGGNDGYMIIGKMPVICFGPIRADTNYHGIDEFVYLEDVEMIKNLIGELSNTEF